MYLCKSAKPLVGYKRIHEEIQRQQHPVVWKSISLREDGSISLPSRFSSLHHFVLPYFHDHRGLLLQILPRALSRQSCRSPSLILHYRMVQPGHGSRLHYISVNLVHGYCESSRGHTSIAAFVLYLLGFLVNIAHMLWEPQAINFLTSIKKQGSSGSTGIFRQWYRMNLIRGALADVPAWSCFLARFLVWESAR